MSESYLLYELFLGFMILYQINYKYLYKISNLIFFKNKLFVCLVA